MVRLKVHGVLADPNTDTQIVVLREDQGSEILPIWVGSTEGQAIRLAIEGIVPPRPTSHDLLKGISEYLGIDVSQVVGVNLCLTGPVRFGGSNGDLSACQVICWPFVIDGTDGGRLWFSHHICLFNLIPSFVHVLHIATVPRVRGRVRA